MRAGADTGFFQGGQNSTHVISKILVCIFLLIFVKFMVPSEKTLLEQDLYKIINFLGDFMYFKRVFMFFFYIAKKCPPPFLRALGGHAPSPIP